MASSPRASAYVAALKLPVTVLCLFATALAAYYFFYVTLHRTYLVERNFRLLATLGEETAGLIQSNERVIQNLAHGDPGRYAEGNSFIEYDSTGKLRISKNAGFFVPVLRNAVFAGGPINPDSYIVRMVERGSRVAWEQRDDTAANGQQAGIVQLELQDVLAPLLHGETGKGIFDALLIAEPDGRVVFQTGDEKLRIAKLDRLTQPGNAKTPDVTFLALSHSPSMADVPLSGSQYVVFTQPCCVRMTKASSPSPPAGEGWVLVGLVAGRTLSADSYAVSFSTLILLCAILTFALLSWPFLKLTFLGESQRVRVHDVLLVAICTLIGLSLLTIGALDYVAYDRHLQSTLDDQLTGLAGEVDQQAKDEIARATDALERLQHAVTALPPDHDPENEPDPNLAHNAGVFSNDTLAALAAYPFFESFALIDYDGLQKRKLTLGSVRTLLISTAEREYFRHWATAPAASKPFIESIRSNTTGAREAVISMASTDTRYRVAALSLPLRSLINPVVVPGFGFAVIDDEGQVLFHSDPQHNLSENFFVEADGNRRLRALVGARHSEFVDTQYWGNDYRALVYPMQVGQRWTLIAFYDKDLIRTVNVEWLILALMLLMMYVGVYVAISVGVLFVRPHYRAPWLWPDPTRSREYVDLLLPLLLLVGAFALAILTLPVTELILAAWLLPLLAWVIVYDSLAQPAGDTRPVWPIPIGCGALLALLILAHQSQDPFARVVLTAALVAAPALVAVALWRRHHERRGGLTLPVNVSFGLMSAICIAVTAVLPPAAFFKVGHSLQLESFIKYGQLQVALDRIDKTQRDQQADAKDVDVLTYDDWSGRAANALKSARSTGMNWGVYHRFFFETKEEDSQICESGGNPAADGDQSARDTSAIPELLEEKLPFYSESSVRLREMVHDRAADHSWSWRHRGSDIIFCTQSNAVTPFRSTFPPIFSDLPFDELITDRVAGLALLVIVALAIRWFVRFTLHKVFAIDVIEPFWSGSRRTLDPWHGRNLFLVNSEPGSLPPQAANYDQVDLACAPDDPAAGALWFGNQFDRLAQSERAQNVLVHHFEHRAQDPAFTEQKVALLERVIAALHRTVVVVSALPPGRFTLATATPPPAPGTAASATAAPAWMPRWTQLLSKFTVVPVGPQTPPGPAPRISVAGWMTAGWRDALWRLNLLGFAHSARVLDDEQRDAVVERFWKEALINAWLPDRPAVTVDQLLIEVGERSETHYREIWDACTPAEKMVLGQIAEEGLVNEKTVRTVRALMSRGLVRRQPNFVVMNETFRQFVISAASRAEVAALEDQATSTWDAIRWPFMILLIGSLAFFFSTQHELYNSTLGILTGLAAALPALAKMASLFSNRPDRA